LKRQIDAHDVPTEPVMKVVRRRMRRARVLRKGMGSARKRR